MEGKLYVVATPIGNLADLSPRAAETLATADFVAAEDTRVTLKLLNHLGLKKPLVSYNQHNARARGEGILARIQAGESCALCSDAGTPAVSDPGELLVAAAHERGVPVAPVAGPCAAIAALSASGQSTGRFVFEGFITQNKRQRAERLAALAGEARTMLIYEAPHKLPATLAQLAQALGPDRPLTLCRELTKLHEEIWPTTLEAAARRYAEETPKGEFVLVVAGAAPPPEGPAATMEEAADLARRYAAQGLKAGEAARRAAAESGQPRAEIYRAVTAGKEKP